MTEPANVSRFLQYSPQPEDNLKASIGSADHDVTTPVNELNGDLVPRNLLHVDHKPRLLLMGLKRYVLTFPKHSFSHSLSSAGVGSHRYRTLFFVRWHLTKHYFWKPPPLYAKRPCSERPFFGLLRADQRKLPVRSWTFKYGIYQARSIT